MFFSSNNYIGYESKDDRNKKLSLEKYLHKIRQYLKDIINNLKKSGTGKIQLAIAINFISSIDNGEEHVMHSKSNNIEIMINERAGEVIKELSKSLKNRYHNNLKSMKEFVFDNVHLVSYKCHKINSNRRRSYIDFPDWIKNKNAIINPINKKDKKVALNHEKIKKDSPGITKIKHFINKHN